MVSGRRIGELPACRKAFGETRVGLGAGRVQAQFGTIFRHGLRIVSLRFGERAQAQVNAGEVRPQSQHLPVFPPASSVRCWAE